MLNTLIYDIQKRASNVKLITSSLRKKMRLVFAFYHIPYVKNAFLELSYYLYIFVKVVKQQLFHAACFADR